jgi:prophage regulatory protein
MCMLRIKSVLYETGHSSKESIYSAIRVGLFTPPVKIGPRSSGWPSSEVSAIVAARIAGQSEAQIRELVKHLIAQRAQMPFAASGANGGNHGV